jgi:hypothetical protein
LLPLIERAQSSALDGRDVNKHVLARALRLNESMPLVGLNHLTMPRAILYLQLNDPLYYYDCWLPTRSDRVVHKPDYAAAGVIDRRLVRE